MADELWSLRVILSNRETRRIEMAGRREEAIEAAAQDLMAGQGEFRNEWVKTSDGAVIARAHIVEIQSFKL